MGFLLLDRGRYNQSLRRQTLLEHRLEQRSPFLQRILNSVSNILLAIYHGLIFIELIQHL